MLGDYRLPPTSVSRKAINVDDEAVEAFRRLGQGTRGVEDAVSFSLAHRLRIEIRAALHEGPATSAQLAKIVGKPRRSLDYHLREMRSDGSIDIAKTAKFGNMDQHYYRVIELPHFSDEDFAAMSEADRQTLCAMAVQAASSEAMASLWAEKMLHDPRLMLAWNRLNLDRQGREDLADEELRSWVRKHEIANEATDRHLQTGALLRTYILTSFAYERRRTSAPEPQSPAERRKARLAAIEHLGKVGRCVEDSVSYSLGHRIRIEIRAALHEGPASASDLEEIIGEPVNLVDYHLKKLLDDGNVQVSKTAKTGNMDETYYTVVSLPYFSDGEVSSMSAEDRQTLCAVAVQAAMTEAMASLHAGKMANDPRVFLGWNRVDLDQKGREDVADEELRSWRRKHEIEAESDERRKESGEEGVTYVITSFSYERSRTSAPDPLDQDPPAAK